MFDLLNQSGARGREQGAGGWGAGGWGQGAGGRGLGAGGKGQGGRGRMVPLRIYSERLLRIF